MADEKKHDEFEDFDLDAFQKSFMDGNAESKDVGPDSEDEKPIVAGSEKDITDPIKTEKTDEDLSEIFEDDIPAVPKKEINEFEKQISKNDNKKKKKKKSKAWIIVTNIIFYVVIFSIIAGSLIFAMSQNASKSIFGYRFYNVLTSSMEPDLHQGSLIFVKITDPETIEVGDDITFYPGSTQEAYLTHRVIEIVPNYDDTGLIGFRTQGIANDSPDSFVTSQNRVVGVVCGTVPYAGYVVSYMQQYWYMVVAIIVLLFVLYVCLNYLFGTKKGKKKEE